MPRMFDVPRQELEAVMASAGSTRSDNGCLIWGGSVRPSGYGLTRAGGKVESAHRIACFLAHGEPPPGANNACHKCDTPSCVEPAHLYWGSRSRNMLDAFERGRLRYQSDPSVLPRGERHGRARLTEADIGLIITSDLSARELALRLSYPATKIRLIRKGKLWAETVAAIRALNPSGSVERG